MSLLSACPLKLTVLLLCPPAPLPLFLPFCLPLFLHLFPSSRQSWLLPFLLPGFRGVSVRLQRPLYGLHDANTTRNGRLRLRRAVRCQPPSWSSAFQVRLAASPRLSVLALATNTATYYYYSLSLCRLPLYLTLSLRPARLLQPLHRPHLLRPCQRLHRHHRGRLRGRQGSVSPGHNGYEVLQDAAAEAH